MGRSFEQTRRPLESAYVTNEIPQKKRPSRPIGQEANRGGAMTVFRLLLGFVDASDESTKSRVGLNDVRAD